MTEKLGTRDHDLDDDIREDEYANIARWLREIDHVDDANDLLSLA